MKYKNIYEVLERYPYSEFRKEDFIKAIKPYKDQINIIDPHKKVRQ